MASNSGSAFLGFVLGAVAVVVVLIGIGLFVGAGTSEVSLDLTRPTIPSNPR